MKKLSDILKGKTCAVVSNSGDLISHEYGEFIDSHDVVIRCNWCLIDGYEKHVGKKTDLKLITPHLARLICDYENVSKDPHFNEVFPLWSSLKIEDIIKDEVVILHPNGNQFLGGVTSELKNNEIYSLSQFGYNDIHIGTGMYAIMLASKLFESVDCFCFDFWTKSAEHYFEKPIVDLTSHDHASAYKISRNLPNTTFYPD
tara:strand:+ start:275 stop:877 length:603 start_codon:yes stop_codon:yes gene_type:complete